ncbi:hypothetical protein M8818_003690 [Zalaria obscura]|uniref:Uncharacterized protein n=1 Tax=Zalaria obscura TaxID=2024903 RepID=A0ACC3SH22_9PEZI
MKPWLRIISRDSSGQNSTICGRCLRAEKWLSHGRRPYTNAAKSHAKKSTGPQNVPASNRGNRDKLLQRVCST